MGEVLVISGPPGAGKSTVGELVADRFEPSLLVEGDVFFQVLRRGATAPWLPESAEQNEVITAATAAAVGELARGPATVVFNGVLGPWFLPTFFRRSGLTSVSYAVLLPPVQQCVDGVLTRTGHGFADEAATRQMHAEFVAAAVEDRHLFTNPPGELEATAAAILTAHAAGTLTITAA
jgi:cytidylate kinase